jgi:hypothetical protein
MTDATDPTEPPVLHTPDEWYDYLDSRPSYRQKILDCVALIDAVAGKVGFHRAIEVLPDAPGGRVGWFILGMTWALLAGVERAPVPPTEVPE